MLQRGRRYGRGPLIVAGIAVVVIALVVALGFDASKDEPLGALAVTEDGFARAAQMIGALKLPTAITQEGGYNVDVIGTLLERFLGACGEA